MGFQDSGPHGNSSSQLRARGMNAARTVRQILVLYIQHIVQTLYRAIMRPSGSGWVVGATLSYMTTAPQWRLAGNEGMGKSTGAA